MKKPPPFCNVAVCDVAAGRFCYIPVVVCWNSPAINRITVLVSLTNQEMTWKQARVATVISTPKPIPAIMDNIIVSKIARGQEKINLMEISPGVPVSMETRFIP